MDIGRLIHFKNQLDLGFVGPMEWRKILTPNIGNFLRLVEYGVDIRADNGICGRFATARGLMEITKRLISLGVDIDNCCGEWPYCARYFDHWRTIRVLSMFGIVPHVPYLSVRLYIQFCDRMKVKARAKAARKLYFCSTYGWVLRGYDLTRRSGRRMRARNFQEYRRLAAAQ